MVAMASATNSWLNVLCGSLSFTVIVSCLVLKVPQIYKVVKQQSSRGLSLNSVLLELCSYSAMLMYHCAKGYPLSTYLEYCFLVPQDIILLLLVLHSRQKLTANTVPLFGLYAIVCCSLALRLVPDAVLTMSVSLVTPVSMSSKLIQIFALIRSKDAGTVSVITWSLAAYSTLARSITTVVQTGDMAVLVNFSFSFILNVTMTSVIIFYQTKKPKEE